MTEDGKPYAPLRYKRVMHESYLISKNMNTSYSDVLQITPRERENLIKFLMDEANETKKAFEEKMNQIQKNRKR